MSGSQAAHVTKKKTDTEAPRLLGFTQDLEQQAMGFFFVAIYPRILGYYTDELPRAYSRESHTSILSTATAALALSFTSLHPHHLHFNSLAVSKYAECLRLVRRAANDPRLAESDAFLMAILLLESFEVSIFPSIVFRTLFMLPSIPGR